MVDAVNYDSRTFDKDFINRLEDLTLLPDETNYRLMKLQGDYSKFIKVPNEIVMHENNKVLLVYMYMALRHGSDNVLIFNFYNISEWSNYMYAYIKDKFVEAVDYLADNGYIKNVNIKKRDRFQEYNCIWVEKKIDECKEYVFIHHDEIQRIADIYNNDKGLKADILFKLFLFFKSHILQRVGKTKSKWNAQKYPEAFYCSWGGKLNCKWCMRLKDKFKFSEDTFGKYMNVLIDNKLLYKGNGSFYLEKNKEDEKLKRFGTIYCLPYVRYGGYVLRGGLKYCESEISKKRLQVKKEYLKGISQKEEYEKNNNVEDNNINSVEDNIEDYNLDDITEPNKEFEEYIEQQTDELGVFETYQERR